MQNLQDKLKRVLKPEPELTEPPKGGFSMSQPPPRRRRKAVNQGDRPRCVDCNRYLPRVLRRFPKETHICRCNNG